MEKSTDKSSIRQILQGVGDPSKKKIVIKKKQASAVPTSSAQGPSKKKNLDDLVKEESQKQSQISPDVKGVAEEHRSNEPSKHEIEKPVKETSHVEQHSKLAYPVRREDKNPIISRPTKPSQSGFQKENRGPRQFGGGGHSGGGNYQRPQQSGGQSQGGNFQRPYGSGQSQGGGNYQRPYGGGQSQGGGNYQRSPGGGQSYQQRQGGTGGSPGNKGRGNFAPSGGAGYRGKSGPGAGKSEFGGSDSKVDIVPEGQSTSRKRTVSHQSEKSREKNEKGLKENIKFFKQAYKKQNLPPVSGTTVPKEISIMENIQVGELAKKMNLKPGDVIAKLMKLGMMVTINNVIDSDTAILLADEYDCKVKIVSLYEETVVPEDIDDPADYIIRPPVVTIMGHVDHGKTKLLDTIRKTSVIDTESGGITQHIGAYQVKIPRGTISFLDTPGHEAFTSMRARGASITDIVVLVVAADDGVKPQTIEAVNHAKAANVPIIVAINKVDLPAANPEKVMQELANLGLQSEEWGGSTITCKVSARENTGIDKLLEMILIQAEVLELKANPKRRAKGTVIEAKLDPGRGAVATVLIQNGTLRIGYPFVAGVYSGRVRAMYDDHGHMIEEAPPSFPVLVTGLEGVPEAGDPFDVLGDEKEARNISQHRLEYQRIGQAGSAVKVTLDNMNEIIQQGGLKELKIIIKADVRGSAEAIKEALEKLTTTDVKLNVIHAGTGAIIDTDVMLASASNAIIVGFHVRANPRTLALAEKEKVQIKYYSIIYDVVNEIKAAMEGMLEPDKVETIIGNVEIRDSFKISKVGNIAGCMVKSGKITKSSSVRIIHDGLIVFDGKLKSLKRVKDDVSEVLTGFECGILFDGYNDFAVGDEIEVYEISTIARKL